MSLSVILKKCINCSGVTHRQSVMRHAQQLPPQTSATERGRILFQHTPSTCTADSHLQCHTIFKKKVAADLHCLKFWSQNATDWPQSGAL